MCELQADETRVSAGTMLFPGEGNQLFERRQILLRQEQLARIGASVRVDCHRLAPQELCTTAGKSAPPPGREFVRSAFEGAVTPLHRVDPQPVADGAGADAERRQRRRDLGLEADLHAEPRNLCYERLSIRENGSAHAPVTICISTMSPDCPVRADVVRRTGAATEYRGTSAKDQQADFLGTSRSAGRVILTSDTASHRCRRNCERARNVAATARDPPRIKHGVHGPGAFRWAARTFERPQRPLPAHQCGRQRDVPDPCRHCPESRHRTGLDKSRLRQGRRRLLDGDEQAARTRLLLLHGRG